jgi:hypothetical protein
MTQSKTSFRSAKVLSVVIQNVISADMGLGISSRCPMPSASGTSVRHFEETNVALLYTVE